jgi:hypothetical protein
MLPHKMLLRARLVILGISPWWLIGCGGPPQPHPGLDTGAERPAPAPEAVATSSARASVAPGTTQAATGLDGVWSLRSDSPRRIGPILDLAIDSASGAGFRVRVAFLLQGDVGLDTARFEPTRGRVDPDRTVSFVVKLREQASPLGEMTGRWDGDTIRLSTYRWAGEDQTARGVNWFLVRQRP